MPCPSGESELYALGALAAEVDFRTSFTEGDWTIIPDTRDSRQQHRTRSDNETSKSQDETRSHDILFHSRFGISETAEDVIGQD